MTPLKRNLERGKLHAVEGYDRTGACDLPKTVRLLDGKSFDRDHLRGKIICMSEIFISHSST
ncbi:MAG: hypothetical protein OJF50_004091 [Nitrospira sp.]|jgi:hypothetical protein|nr:hypothetical protein [Nitrospira sp.]